MIAPSGFHDDLTRFSSKTTISGEITQCSHNDPLLASNTGLTAALLQMLPQPSTSANPYGNASPGSDVASNVVEQASYFSDSSAGGGGGERPNDTPASCAVFQIEKPSVSGVGASNKFVLVMANDWKEGCSFLDVGDEVTLSHFDVLPGEYAASLPSIGAALSPNVMLVTPNFSSEITAVRKKKVVINAKNVGQFELLSFTDRERKTAADLKKSLAAGMGANTATSKPSGMTSLDVLDAPAPTDVNSFSKAHRYYDIMFGQRKEFNKKIDFVMNIIAQAADNSVLDIGCGSGLLGFSLRYSSIFPVLVDKSLAMGEIVAEKNKFVAEAEDARSTTKGQQLQFYNADARNFSLRQTNQDGQEVHVDFSTVLCLGTIGLMDSPEEVQRVMHNLHLHTALGGTAIVSFPNKDAIMAQRYTQCTKSLPIDKHMLCVGASTGLSQGQLDVLIRTQIIDATPSDANVLQAYQNVSDQDESDEEDEAYDFEEGETMARDGVPRLQTTYTGSALHRHGPTKQTTFADFTDTTTELLMSGGLIDTIILSAGFDIDEIFGDDAGSEFNQATSLQRVYILRKRSAV